MSRLVSSLALVALPFLALGPTVALAASPSQTSCEQQGGTYTHQGGTATCVTTSTTNVGNSPNSQTTTTTSTTGGQGNLSNKQTTQSTCSGPGNSGSSSAHC